MTLNFNKTFDMETDSLLQKFTMQMKIAVVCSKIVLYF